MAEYHSALQMNVMRDGAHHYKNWRTAVFEAWELAKKLGVAIDLSYAGQYTFCISPENTQEELVELCAKKLAIGL